MENRSWQQETFAGLGKSKQVVRRTQLMPILQPQYSSFKTDWRHCTWKTKRHAGEPDWKSTHYEEYVNCNVVVWLCWEFWGGICHNMACAELSPSGPWNSQQSSGNAQTRESYINGETSPNRSTKWPNKPKRPTKLENLVKMLTKLLYLKKVKIFFSKIDPINSAQFLVCWVWHSHAQTQHDGAPSPEHQHGRVSGVVDGNFSYW